MKRASPVLLLIITAKARIITSCFRGNMYNINFMKKASPVLLLIVTAKARIITSCFRGNICNISFVKKRSPMLLLLTVSFFSLNNACRKSSEPTLPDATQSGANTAGCLLNGQLWIASSDNCFRFGTPDREKGYFSYDVVNKRLKVFFKRCTINEVHFFSLAIEDFHGPGRYDCNRRSYLPGFPGSSGGRYNNIWFYSVSSQGSVEKDYVTNEEATGVIIITKIDTLSKPIFAAGTFECKLKNLNNIYDSLTIKLGRFDIINQ